MFCLFVSVLLSKIYEASLYTEGYEVKHDGQLILKKGTWIMKVNSFSLYYIGGPWFLFLQTTNRKKLLPSLSFSTFVFLSSQDFTNFPSSKAASTLPQLFFLCCVSSTGARLKDLFY